MNRKTIAATWPEGKLKQLQSSSLIFILVVLSNLTGLGQALTDFNISTSYQKEKSSIANSIHFNGYTNHWQDYYTEWHRYGNLFKIAIPNLKSTILQSQTDVAEDLNLSGLLVQEGILSHLFMNSYETVEQPDREELEKLLKRSNALVITSPESEVGQILENKATTVFDRADSLPGHQFGQEGLETIKLFFLQNNDRFLFVISSSSESKSNHLQILLKETRNLLNNFKMYKGWFGVKTLLKSVTSTPGHPVELIGIGMNEGVSWFVFDGYMDFLAKEELERWVEEVNLPVVADAGYSPVYGCSDYNGLQVQDMATKQTWIDFAHKKGGYAFRPVYDPESDGFQYDGYIAQEGNKEQIDNENIPFISTTGFLSDNLTSSMVLFIEKEKKLTNQSVWEAIMDRKSVAILNEAKMTGPAHYRNALQFLYLDKEYLEDYYNDKMDLHSEIDDEYNLIVTLHNYELSPVTGRLNITASQAIGIDENFTDSITLMGNERRRLKIALHPGKDAMKRTNPVAVDFSWDNKQKSTVTILDLPPVVSLHQLLYAHAPEVNFPVTVHNYSEKSSFPVEAIVYEKENLSKEVFRQIKTCEAKTAAFSNIHFNLQLKPGSYIVKVNALDTTSESQLGVGKPEGSAFAYETDLDSDGVSEIRMENDSVRISLLKIGARVIEYIIKSKNDNVLFKLWPEKPANYKFPYRKRLYYPYGGFEDFLGQASMETHELYDAEIVQKEGNYVQVEMEADYFGNHLKKIYTLYGNSPLLEVRFELTFKNPEANMLGPQPILELGKSHGTEDVFMVPTMEGLKEYRMRPEKNYGQAIQIKEGWNAGYDTNENISFVGAYPVNQPIFLHMWMNTPKNVHSPYYYNEFQPWTPIIQKSTMYFSYYLWGSSGTWQNSLNELKERNLITVR